MSRPSITKPAARTATVAALAAALALPAAASAAPAQSATPLAGTNSGLTAPAGIVRTPDGSLWVADAIRGICRAVDPGGAVVPVTQAQSPYCGAVEGDHGGPLAATGLGFDAQTSTIYASDGASKGGNVWRWRWNATTKAIEDGAIIASLPDDRIDAMTVAAGAQGPEVFFVTKRTSAVMKVAGLGAGAPVDTVGFATHGATGIAVFEGLVYLAEGGSVTSLRASSSAPFAEPVVGLEAAPASAVAIDAANRRLYAGTFTPDARDRVEVLDLDDGSTETYEIGFAGVSSMLVEAGERPALLVADDHGEASGAIDTADQGRLWTIPFHGLHRPSVEWTASPRAYSAQRTFDVAYRATSATATLQCRLSGTGDVPLAGWESWQPCDSGSTALGPLDDGTYRFSVRAVDPAIEGAPLESTRTFTVDARAPRVWVAQPQQAFVEGEAAPAIDFAADESFVQFWCSVDGATATVCAPGDGLDGLAVGSHTLKVSAVDLAGNQDATGTTVTFAVRRPDPKPVAPAPPVPAPPAPPAAASAAASAQPPVAAATVAPRPLVAKPILFPFRLAPGTMKRPSSRRAAKVVATFKAPASARTVRFTLTDARRRRVLTRTMRVRPGATTKITINLTRSERVRLRAGVYLLSAVLADKSGVQGNTQTHFLRVRATD